jgi:hypothetical protein
MIPVKVNLQKLICFFASFSIMGVSLNSFICSWNLFNKHLLNAINMQDDKRIYKEKLGSNFEIKYEGLKDF